MDWIEIIHLRSYTETDREQALDAFGQLAMTEAVQSFRGIRLLRDIDLENDLSIFIYWRGSDHPEGKSPLGLQVASAFSEFGQINHSVWLNAGRISSTAGEVPPVRTRSKRDQRGPA